MIHFELVTLDGIKFRKDVYEVMLPTPDGQIAIFQHHAPLVSQASPGIIAIRRQEKDDDDHLEYFATNGGVVEVLDNGVRLLADEADREDEINEQEAQKAYEQAQQLLRQAKDQIALDKAQNLIDRSRVRIQVANLRRRRRR
jgi:F-type H+-transporting ATPase subunit epsilon